MAHYQINLINKTEPTQSHCKSFEGCSTWFSVYFIRPKYKTIKLCTCTDSLYCKAVPVICIDQINLIYMWIVQNVFL